MVTKYYLFGIGPKTCAYNFALGSAWTPKKLYYETQCRHVCDCLLTEVFCLIIALTSLEIETMKHSSILALCDQLLHHDVVRLSAMICIIAIMGLCTSTSEPHHCLS